MCARLCNVHPDVCTHYCEPDEDPVPTDRYDGSESVFNRNFVECIFGNSYRGFPHEVEIEYST
eukprot:1525313-Pyramimonas_sp.AAC.1